MNARELGGLVELAIRDARESADRSAVARAWLSVFDEEVIPELARALGDETTAGAEEITRPCTAALQHIADES